jgi:hypothetical protein
MALMGKKASLQKHNNPNLLQSSKVVAPPATNPVNLSIKKTIPDNKQEL